MIQVKGSTRQRVHWFRFGSNRDPRHSGRQAEVRAVARKHLRQLSQITAERST